MKKRGFTLIELLAVIVILAILALITVPIVLKLVNNARRDSSIRSAENYLDGVKKAVMNDAMNSEVEFDYCEVQSNGNILCNEKYNMQIDVDGAKPTKGTINFGGGTISDVEDLKFGKYYISGEVNSLVASTKSSDQDREEGEFLVGDKITYKGERYYVIRRATQADEYLTLMKMYPLSKDEVVEYGLDSNGVNRAYKYESGSRNSTVGSRNGYGIVPYYSGDRCGYGYYCTNAGCNWQTIETNCANSYDQSDIKVIVDNWAKDVLNLDDLVEVDGYKARLLNDNDLTQGLKFSTEPSGGWSTGVYFRTSKTPKWVSNGDYYYWMMNTDEDTKNSAHIMGEGYVFAQKVNENGEWSAGAVRPVINVAKAALTEENAKASGLLANSSPKYAICKSTDGAATPTVGGKYACEVKSGTTFNFYVLSTNSGQIDMIMDRNICENGQAATDGNPCLYAWDSGSSENYRGPKTAMEKLYQATKDWDNIPYSYYSYYDESKQSNSSYGYTKIEINGTNMNFYDRYSSSTYYNYPDASKKMKTRLITYKELYNKASCGTASGTCKTWSTKNLSGSQPGYWTLSTSMDNKRFYNAIAVDNTRRITTAKVNQAKYGIRPVIRLSTSNLKQGEEVQQDNNTDYNYTQQDIQNSDELVGNNVVVGSGCEEGKTWNFVYEGEAQTFKTTCEGRYKLEVWGAQGGNATRNTSSIGGKGGYSVGTINLMSSINLYIYVGGVGKEAIGTNLTSGGFNGGGGNYSAEGGATGGGASDVRIGTDSLYARVIVAGGGSGAAWGNLNGAAGGGTTGINGTKWNGYAAGLGGKQTSGGDYTGTPTGGGQKQSITSGSFGLGGRGSGSSAGGSGGGGGWYGGGGGMISTGGGGSGYVYTSSTASSYPSGCLLNSAYYLSNASTIAGNQSFASPNGGTETGHSGNGYARITYLGN